MYIYTPLCRYWIALYRYVLVFIVPHVGIELEDNKQCISNIPRNILKYYCHSESKITERPSSSTSYNETKRSSKEREIKVRIFFFFFLIHFYTPPHNSGGVLWFHVGRPWVVRPSVFCLGMITWVNINGFSPNLVCALILWRSGLGLLMAKFRQFLTELPARDTPKFWFPDDNLSKHQWIFTKLGMCIEIVDIWFGIANGQISSIFDRVICPRHAHIFVSGL